MDAGQVALNSSIAMIVQQLQTTTEMQLELLKQTAESQQQMLKLLAAAGVGENLEGLQFRGMMWVTLYTPFPMPYEYVFPYGSDAFDMPEGYVIGTIKE